MYRNEKAKPPIFSHQPSKRHVMAQEALASSQKQLDQNNPSPILLWPSRRTGLLTN